MIDVAARRVAVTWLIPNGGSPTWAACRQTAACCAPSGRYNSEVYAIDAADGHLLARIRVGKGPHGLLRVAAARALQPSGTHGISERK